MTETSRTRPETLEEAATIKGPVLVAVAVKLGGCRLIDSLICQGE